MKPEVARAKLHELVAGWPPCKRFVPVKTAEQQGLLAVHRLREGYKEDRTACINRIRGVLTEFGLVFAQSAEALLQALPDVIEDATNELPWIAGVALRRCSGHRCSGRSSTPTSPGATSASP